MTMRSFKSIFILTLSLILPACAITRQSPEDASLLHEVRFAIRDSSEVSRHRAYVTVHDSVVFLNGTVETGYDRWAIERAVATVEGVSAIRNYITVY